MKRIRVILSYPFARKAAAIKRWSSAKPPKNTKPHDLSTLEKPEPFNCTFNFKDRLLNSFVIERRNVLTQKTFNNCDQVEFIVSAGFDSHKGFSLRERTSNALENNILCPTCS